MLERLELFAKYRDDFLHRQPPQDTQTPIMTLFFPIYLKLFHAVEEGLLVNGMLTRVASIVLSVHLSLHSSKSQGEYLFKTTL